MIQNMEFEPWEFFVRWFKRAVLTYLSCAGVLAAGLFLTYWGYFLWAQPSLGQNWSTPTTALGWAFAAMIAIIGPLSWIILWLSVVLLLIFPVLLVAFLFFAEHFCDILSAVSWGDSA